MTTFRIPLDHPALPGHFPGRPIVPGVVVLDRVLAAIEAQGVDAAAGANRGWRMPQVKFMQPLLPEQTARIELERLTDAADGAPRWRFRVSRDETPIASGEVRAA